MKRIIDDPDGLPHKAQMSRRADISTLPQFDAAILQQVRDLGRYPQELKNPQTLEEIAERNLCKRIRVHREAFHSDTLEELHALKADDAYWWCTDLRSAKQRMEQSHQGETCTDRSDELLRRIDVMLSDPSRSILLAERYVQGPPSTNRLSDWWQNAGIILRSKIPAFCTTAECKKQCQGHVSLKLMHYLLSHSFS